MRSIKDFELPPHLRETLKKAKKLEWITLVYLVSVTILMYLVLGSSQAMKTAWLEDVLSIIPSAGFLIASKINSKAPNDKFPFGYHRVFSIAFLVGAVALLGMGLFLVFDSSMTLIKKEHPTIGHMQIFGYTIWMGWIMIAALIYSAAPAMWLGQKKVPMAKKLHNKLLYTDASAQKADYLTALAAILGILGVGMGLWWADSVAAIFISASILKDGFKHTKTAALDLMDRYPQRLLTEHEDEIIIDVSNRVKSWPWVKEAKVRFREAGQVYFGQIAVVPKGELDMDKLIQGYDEIKEMHWKLHDFTIDPVKELPKW
ncbi:cation diffusion facilitator family transporter [Salinimicrobium oceani]|uniref:Cation diffusion facilitator family transporter n=1 Tax=Salinimicrobium oceani TaxID=2722702 RepID=A0ABX1CTF2_9FLAO|nr:cation diffusion facilitator family transporter [Salinimicrobium oceani]NJW51552.1 cation diffusion facilitator family transporter [Salinimicrobium oceani]